MSYRIPYIARTVLLVVVVALCLPPIQSPSLAASRQGTLQYPALSPALQQDQSSAWESSLTQQLGWWKAQYPNTSLSFIVIRLGVSQGPQEAQQVAWTLASQWQRPVIALPSFAEPNSHYDDAKQAIRSHLSRIMSDSAPDNGVKVLETIIGQGHKVQELHFFSGGVMQFNAEYQQYADFFANPKYRQSGPQAVVGFGAKVSNEAMEAVKPFGGGKVQNLGHDWIYQATKFPYDQISPALSVAKMTQAAIVGPSHNILNYETEYAKTKILSGTQVPPPSLKPTTADAVADPGGIDFSSFEMNYFAEFPADNQRPQAFGVIFEGDRALSDVDKINTALSTRIAWDSFFVWLALDPNKFWVNLNPNEPDRIIDPGLGTTDAGRIMLVADLEMKKTAAKLINPKTASGKQFWDQLDQYAAEDHIETPCLSFRQWIVPGKVTVWETSNTITILDSTLDVKLEGEYKKLLGKEPSIAGCPPETANFAAKAEKYYGDNILPQIIKAVNTAPEYEALRNVYKARIIAEWYKTRHVPATTNPLFGYIIGSEDVSQWPAVEPWKPIDVFNDYVKSFKDGEFHEEITETKVAPDGSKTIVTKTYIYGGVDLSQIESDTKPQMTALEEHPTMTEEQNKAFSDTGYVTPAEAEMGNLAVDTSEPPVIPLQYDAASQQPRLEQDLPWSQFSAD